MRTSLPVVANADDLVRLATKTTSCTTCKHRFGEDWAPKCGAHGGSYCTTVNPKGSCVSWEQAPRSRSFWVPLLKITATAALVFIVIFLSLQVRSCLDDRCHEYADRFQGMAKPNCDHPDHHIEIVDTEEDGVYLCRCASEQP